MRADRHRPRRRGLAWLFPWRWPLRTRLAAVSAVLTFVILVAFALVVGRLATNQLTSDFRDELRTSANELAANAQVVMTFEGEQRVRLVERPDLREMVMSDDSVVRFIDASGDLLETSRPGLELGAPSPGIERVGDYEVVSQQVVTSVLGEPVFVQYARSRASLDRTLGRLWLFLGGGVFGGTILAALAGLAVARRAMRPIADLTATAREIATTRDPSKRIPRPETEDEVAELARTLDEMLRELDAARAETEHMVQAQREFVADASHELRTPLTSILANLELLQASLAEDGRPGEESEIVGGALRSSQRMRRLVSDLLLLARADAGRVGVRRECDLAAIASSATDEVRAFAPDHELVLDAPGPVRVEGSSDELHRLILNLLENGVRHTAPGTEIRARLACSEGDAVLEVSDDGPGLPEGLGQQVFARFVRGAGPADLAADSGTGLGLAIVKAVAQAHGGSVRAGSVQDGGARFEVRLPLTSAPAREPAAPARA
jgi:two-component system, OmpR family, sensor kinase